MFRILCFGLFLSVAVEDLTPVAWDGYRGIWYMNQPTGDAYRYKYSGGFATYPQWHLPIAIYAPEARKTFFVLGGSNGNISERKDELVHLVGYFNHESRKVSRPVRLLNKKTEDAHDNPVLSIDASGHLWVFSAAHGVSRPAYVHRSRRPYDIADWELIRSDNFSYPQPWFLPGRKEFLFLHTLYRDGQRSLHFSRSRDGRQWTEPELFAHIDMGDYQISWPHQDKVATVFDMHPSEGRAGKGLNYRTNLYYLESADAGRTWRTVEGREVTLPLRAVDNPARVFDYLSLDQSVYLKDLAFTPNGRPIVLYLTSRGFAPGPTSGPYEWWTAHWDGRQWQRHKFGESDHNYDHGSLYVEGNLWRIIAPLAPGPQPFGTGGEMEMWTSTNQGQSWQRVRRMTDQSQHNHSYARKPLNAHPDFYAIWADGNPLAPSSSRVHFATRDGAVYTLPEKMTAAEEPALPRRQALR